MREYNEVLVRKLEEKNQDLERAQAELLRTNQKLQEHAETLAGLNAELDKRVAERTAELATANQELTAALAQVKELSGLLPICSHCKKVRDDKNYWHSVEGYIAQHTRAKFSHSVCPECYEKVVLPQLESLKRQLWEAIMKRIPRNIIARCAHEPSGANTHASAPWIAAVLCRFGLSWPIESARGLAQSKTWRFIL